jgi:Fe2+ or Zn2+ uptake regulation protein
MKKTRTIIMKYDGGSMTPRPRARRRTTWQRTAILQTISQAPCHVTAEELYDRLRRTRPIGLATIYRALDAFVRDGVLERAHVGDGKVRYGLAARHHDHLVCLSCGAWEPLKTCLVPRVPRRIASGFTVTGHQVELYGYCTRCQTATG